MSSQNPQFDFRRFLETVKDMDYLDMISYAVREADWAERISYKVRGAVLRRKQGSTEYVRKIGQFLFWLRRGIRPASATEEDFQSYKIVAKRLVEKNQFKPEALNIFNKD